MLNRDDIIKLAREAGFVHSNPHSEVIVRHSNGSWQSIEERLDQFAALVAAAEREACAQVCDAASEPRKGYGQTDEQWAASTLAERIRARGHE